LMSVVYAIAVPHPPLIVPEVGRGQERMIQNTIDGYREVSRRLAEFDPDTIIVISPHTVMYTDYIHISPGDSARGDLARFRAPQVTVEVEYDADFVHKLSELCEAEGLAAGTLGERNKDLDHGTLIPLYFLQEYKLKAKVVRIGISGLPFTDHYRLGELIAQVSDRLDRKTVIIASGDLSHKLTHDGPYGYSEVGAQFDSRVMEVLSSGEFIKLLDFTPEYCETVAECGLRSFIMMAGALDGREVHPEFHSYEGPFGVGYGICSFDVKGLGPDRSYGQSLMSESNQVQQIESGKNPYVQLARLSLETFIRTGRRAPLPEGLPAEMLDRRAGAFVTLYKNGQLRGCIGTIEPTCSSVAEEIMQNAISSGTTDSRFNRVSEAELEELEYSVDVLSEREPVESISQLDVKRYGVVVSKGFRRGLLLPNLEGVDTPEVQVAIAKQKAGIRVDDNKVQIERFEVVRHK
ncbi:MAG: AmmeMemoRadiSam system protein A, partial [Eubacteriales bacterium]